MEASVNLVSCLECWVVVNLTKREKYEISCLTLFSHSVSEVDPVHKAKTEAAATKLEEKAATDDEKVKKLESDEKLRREKFDAR